MSDGQHPGIPSILSHQQPPRKALLNIVQPITRGGLCNLHSPNYFIRIPQGAVRANCSSYGQTLQLHTVPTPTPHVPSQDRLIPHEVDLAIGKALTGVNIGTTGLQVIAANFFRCQRNGKASDQRNQNNQKLKSHTKLLRLSSAALSG